MLELLNHPVPEYTGMDRQWQDAVTLKYATPANVTHTLKGTIYGIDLQVYDDSGSLIYSIQGTNAFTGTTFSFDVGIGTRSLKFKTQVRSDMSLESPRIGLDIQLNGLPASIDINEVSDFDKAKVRMMLISYANKLTIVPDKISPNFQQLRFIGASLLNHPNISQWDVSNLTVMDFMFSGCAVFNQPLNSWNTTNVTRMASVFSGCSKFNQTIANWNVSNVTVLSYMFSSCRVYNQNLSSMIFKASADRENYDAATLAWLAVNKPKFTGT